VHLLLLLDFIDHIRQVVKGDLHGFGLSEELGNQLVIVTYFILSFLKLVLVIFIASLVQFFNLCLDGCGSLVEVSYLGFVKKLQLFLNVDDLVCHSSIFLGGWLPITSEVLDDVKPFLQVIQSQQDSDVFPRLVVENVYFDGRVLVPLILLLLFLVMSVAHFLDHAIEFHHVDLSSCDLS